MSLSARSLVVDAVAARVEQAGVHHVFGVGGANIEDLFAAVMRRQPGLRAILTKHEHGAGTAADAYARVTGGLGVVMVTSGGAAMNLVHSLAEALASRVPVLALIGEPPSEVQGKGAFQDTSGRAGAVDAEAVFRAVSVWCARAEQAREVPRLLEQGIAAALNRRGPAVLLLEKNLQRAEVDAGAGPVPNTARATPPDTDAALDARALDAARAYLASGPVLIIAGDQVARAGAQAALAALARRTSAAVAVTPDARDAFDNASARFVGVVGAMGHTEVVNALRKSAVCLLVGTRLPLLARQGLEPLLAERAVVSMGLDAPFVQSVALHVQGCPRALCAALAERLPAPPRSDTLAVGARVAPPRSVAPGVCETLLPSRGGARQDGERFDIPAVLARLEREIEEGSVVLADAGNTGACVAHYLRAPRAGRWLLAMGMAGMGYSFGAAIGAACASGRRCLVFAGDGAFFMHGLEVHTALQHALPITFVIFDNRAHGMCLMRERYLVGEEHGYNRFGPAHIGAGLGAMFPGLPSHDCASLAQLERALAATRGTPGPVLLSIELSEIEVPPFAALQAAARRAAPAAAKQERP